MGHHGRHQKTQQGERAPQLPEPTTNETDQMQQLVSANDQVQHEDSYAWGQEIRCGSDIPSFSAVDELSNSEKLKNLYSVVKAEGSRLAQMEYVDVRWKIPRGKRR